MLAKVESCISLCLRIST
jgi:alkylation response protein AidB-like acyl-CoA dehydrogenase